MGFILYIFIAVMHQRPTSPEQYLFSDLLKKGKKSLKIQKHVVANAKNEQSRQINDVLRTNRKTF